MKHSPIRVVPALVLPCLALWVTGCGPTGPGEIKETRQLFEDEQEIVLNASDKDRFRFAAAMMPGGADPAEAPAQEGAAAATPPALDYEKPDSWAEAPASSMRDLNFSFGDNAEGEAYLARLGGTGGGLAPNVNRWRQQMGLEAMTDQEIAALPTISLFGIPATYLDLEGTFTGMGGGEGQPDYGMLGVILSTPQGAVFVKATAPRPLIEKEKENFEAFVTSLSFGR